MTHECHIQGIVVSFALATANKRLAQVGPQAAFTFTVFHSWAPKTGVTGDVKCRRQRSFGGQSRASLRAVLSTTVKGKEPSMMVLTSNNVIDQQLQQHDQDSEEHYSQRT